MRLYFWMGCLLLSNLAIASAQDSTDATVIESGGGETSETTEAAITEVEWIEDLNFRFFSLEEFTDF